MKTLNIFARKSVTCASTLLLVSFLGGTGLVANEAPPTSETSGTKRLSLLVDSAPYSQSDKQALKAGLAAAAPNSGKVADHISQSTIDIQVKNTTRDLPASITFLFDITKCLEQNRLAFLASPQFERVPVQERDLVASYLQNIIDEYSARTLEGLFAQHGRNVQVPANVERSVTNAAYRQLLTLTARSLQQKVGTRLMSRTPTHHTVQIGDSLAAIARKYQLAPDVIVKANPGLVPGYVRVGQIIYIPAPVSKEPARPVAAAERTVSLKAAE